MKVRHGLLLAGLLALAGCSWMPFGHHKAPQQTLMKSLSGEVDYHLAHELPPDAYLEVALSDISKPDVPARVIANDRIAAPIGPSPVAFVLSYEPGDLRSGTDFTVSAAIKQGDRTLATNDTQVRVLGNSGNAGPVLVVVSEAH